MNTKLLSIFAVVVAVASCPAAAQQTPSEARFALLIGNVNYNSAIGKLENPKHDIDAVESALLRIGFPRENVVKEVDASAGSLRDLLRSYTARVKAAGEGTISFFYYSGHGAAAPDGTRGAKGNYIIPYDLDSVSRSDLWERAVSLDEINKILGDADSAVHIVIFDACRKELKLPTRGDPERGFEPIALSGEVQMLIAFAAAPKRIAYDNYDQSHNGPYAHALSEELAKAGLDHMHLFSNIRRAVLKMTRGNQMPWTHDGLTKPLILHAASVPAKQPDGTQSDNKCDITAASLSTPEPPIVWTELPGKSLIRFRGHGYTYTQARINAGLIEEVEEGVAHRIKSGTKILLGSQDGTIQWYSYERDVGSIRKRYVIAENAEIR